MEDNISKIDDLDLDLDEESAEESRVQKSIDMVKIAHQKVFHRETWLKKRLSFAEDWLRENDKEWFDKNGECANINQSLGTGRCRSFSTED